MVDGTCWDVVACQGSRQKSSGEAEAAFTQQEETDGALSLWGSVAANRCSSTRLSLLLGALLSLY